MKKRTALISLMTLLFAVHTAFAATAPKDARWIWYPERGGVKSVPGGSRFFRTEVNVPAGVGIKAAKLYITIDNLGKVHVNGKLAANKRSGWSSLDTIDLRKHLKPGKNVLAIEATNQGSGPAGLYCWLQVTFTNKKKLVIASNDKWLSVQKATPGWSSARGSTSNWKKAAIVGKMGMGPWGNVASGGGGGKGGSSSGDYLHVVDEARPLSAEDTRKMLESDWLFQADNNPDAERARKEITWARELAARISSLKGIRSVLGDIAPPDFSRELAKLKKIETELDKTEDEEKITQLYYDIRSAKRSIMFKNPLIDFNEILMIDGPYPKVGHGHSNHESGHRNGSWYRNTGSRMQVLKGLNPGGEVRDLLPNGTTGFLWRPDLSFDAKKVAFCMMPEGERSFNLYEMNINGTGMRQLTSSPYDDLDPIYLPDGNIMFCTTRGNTYVRCLPTSPAFVLARCNSDGSNIRITSRNNEPDYLPALLHDGSVIYTRWEYTERPLWRLQGLWTTNPDGTAVQVYWGNRSSYPDMLVEARPIPGSKKVIFAGVGHHVFFDGSIGILDISKGREYPNGLWKVTKEVRWPETGDGRSPAPPASDDYHNSGRYTAYKSPYPLGPEDFLVSIRNGRTGSGNSIRFTEEFSLYLMDIHGNRELIYRGIDNVWYVTPLKPRKRPPVRPDVVHWPKAGEKAKGGVLYSADVYEGVEGLPRGKAKYLRVIQMDAKTYSAMTKTWRHSGPTISVIQEDGVKRILGTVPVEADGSVHFKVPSGQALHFQLLDKDYRCLQIMRSFTGVMPGEARGCHGCHEQKSNAPVSFNPTAMAMRRSPSPLKQPPWGADVSIGYERFAQPVLDKYCGRCHQGDKNPKARKKLDLTLRGGVKEKMIKDPKLYPFKEPYLTLVGPAWSSPGKIRGAGWGIAGCLSVEVKHRDLANLKPMTMLSYTSPLINMVMKGTHNKVKVQGEDLRRLIAWVDLNCVYRGDEEVRMIPDPPPSVASRFPVPPQIKSAPVIDRLQPINDAVRGR